MKNIKENFKSKHVLHAVVGLGLLSFGTGASALTLGGMASAIIGSFSSLTSLITACSYLAGLGFAISAIMKFKQHKDNPTQTQIGQPIGLTLIAAALLFLPTILGITGATMFGEGSGEVAGPSGMIFTG
ncbi:MAG: type IV secretion protein IcmD [Legionellaceae bacterium]